MSTTQKTPDRDLKPEAVLAEATSARGDIFPEWKVLAYASPQTYHLVTRTGGYFHKYRGEGSDEQQLSVQMRELIATPALCSKNDLRHSPNHIRRMYRMGMTNAVIMEGAVAFSVAGGWATIANVGYAIMEANNPAYPFGELPAGGEPHELTPFPELALGRKRAGGSDGESMLDTPEWRYAAEIDPEFARRAAAWVDHCLLAEGAREELLGPGPRELIVIAALCTRGEVDLAARHIRRAYDYGMTRRQVLEAISSIVPMTGMISAELGLRAMQAAESAKA
ncbi:MAG: carboxymuconolactone decarboxylase family protein [Betaproteobacteria bacterium]|nr:carboxymuconolactone decarboxylase family protein [Betaproteobacteria bacterium]